MTRQEEIREGIDRVLFALESGEISVFEAKQQLSEWGMVLKVEKPLPERHGLTFYDGDYAYHLGQNDMADRTAYEELI